MIDKPRVLLVDLSSLFWSAWHVNHENGIQEARTATLAGVKRAMADASDLVAICCDSGKSFRKEISAEYKAQREKQPEAAYGELNKTKDRLRADGFLLWEAPTFEADDIIATACDKACAAGHEVRIASGDKDMFQLIGTGRDVLRTSTWEVWNAAKVEEKFKIKPTQMGDFLALKGDTSDNIPGCQGIGDVRAAQLLAKYGNLDKLYAAIDAGQTVATPANLKALTEQRAAVMLSRKLVELRYDVPIEFEQIYAERKCAPLTTGENDMLDEPEETVSTAAGTGEPSPSSASTAPVESSSPTGESATTKAIAQYVAPPAEFERQLEPLSIAGAYKLSKGLFDSRLYSRFPNPEAIMAVIIRGREMGLGALTALDSFHVIEGRPCPHAYLMIARAKADPDCEYLYCVETSDESATWETKNRRNPTATRLTYTLAQAKASGLVQPAQEKESRDGRKYMAKANQWVIRPSEMCRKTAGVQLARMEYPAAVMGLYAYEEMGGDE